MEELTDHDRIIRIDEKVDQVVKILLGNGQPGLYHDFIQLKQVVSDLNEVAPTKKERTTAIVALVGTFITALGGVVVAIVG